MTRIHRIFKLLTICCVLFGCASSPHGNSLAATDNNTIDTNKVVDASRLTKGGNLLIIPLRAGAGVPATEELDKISLMFVKGAIEALQKGHSPFKILNASNAESADLIIKGHVIRLSESQGLKRWIKKEKRLDLGVDAEMIDEKTGQTVLYFLRQKTAIQKSEDYKSMAYDLGQDIGQFILNQLRPL